MPAIEVSLNDLSQTIKNLSPAEMETLMFLLSDESVELLKRKNDIEEARVNTLKQDDIFDV